jgi:Protein kinase domain/Anaphase-promoting complex subunit 4 WD40 domain
MAGESTGSTGGRWVWVHSKHASRPAPSLPASLRLTQQLGPYRIVRELARGGMGAVYEAVHETTGARYAVKTLLPDALGDPDERIRFAREARALAEVDHPHIVRVHTAELEGRTPYLVQDLLPGGSLKDRLREGPLPPAEAARIAIKLAGALAAVHAKGVLHRDLKPDNVLLDDRGEPRLTDFGLAKRLQGESQRLTQTGALVGTPAFMAPEQASGEPMDERTDVYGLGATLYALLCGQPPFSGHTLINILEAVLRRPPPPLPDTVPAPLQAVVARALAKEPEQRFPDMAALGAALEEALAGGAPARRSWGPALGLGGVAVTGLLLATTQPWSQAVRDGGASPPGPTEAPAPERPGLELPTSWSRIVLDDMPLGARYLDDQRVVTHLFYGDVLAFDGAGNRLGADWSLQREDRRRAVKCWSPAPGGQRLVWFLGDEACVADAITGARQQRQPLRRFHAACPIDGGLIVSYGEQFVAFDWTFTETQRVEGWGGAEVLAASPNRQWLAYAERDTGLLRLCETRRIGVPVAAVELKAVQGLSWSPDGDRLAAVTREGHVYWARVTDEGTLEGLTQLHGSLVPGSQLQFSPNGRALAAVGPETGIQVWDVDRDRVLREQDQERRVISLDLSPDRGRVLLAVRAARGQPHALLQLPVEELFGD